MNQFERTNRIKELELKEHELLLALSNLNVELKTIQRELETHYDECHHSLPYGKSAVRNNVCAICGEEFGKY